MTEPEVTEPEEISSVPTRGSNDGTTYESAYSGLSYTLPQGWHFASDAEIAELMGIGADVMGMEEEYQQIISSLNVIYDMMATAPDNSNVIVMYENLAMNNAAGMSEDDYLDIVANGLRANSLGYQVSDQVSSIGICGKTFYTISASVSYNGVDMTQSYYVRTLGDYIICICCTCVGNTTPADLLANFN